MTCLVFANLSLANTAITQIDSNRGYPLTNVSASNGTAQATKQKTTAWATARQKDGDTDYWIRKSAAGDMTGVSDYSEEEFDSNWLPAE